MRWTRLPGVVVASLSLLVAGCGDGSTPAEPPPGQGGTDMTDLRDRFDLEPVPDVPYPDDNAYDPTRVELGRLMFFDPILGGEKDVACVTCHHPDLAFADGRQLGAGVSGEGLGPERELGFSRLTHQEIEDEPRNSQTILNAAFNGAGFSTPTEDGFQFWDGRTRGLEEQAGKPITSRAEMRGFAYTQRAAQDSVLERLRSIPEYRHRFEEAFPDVVAEIAAGKRDTLITLDTYGRALAAYERELVAVNAPYDRWLAGDEDAMTPRQKEGLELFFTKAKCGACHFGPMFSNFQMMVGGVPQVGPGKEVLPGDDTGREEATMRERDRYAFRTPTLRNVELTAPYMHDGVFETLEDVVHFYNAGAQPRHPEVTDLMLPPELRTPLGLTADEIDAVVAFMKALTADVEAEIPRELRTVPERVPSGLPPVFGVRAEGYQGN